MRKAWWRQGKEDEEDEEDGDEEKKERDIREDVPKAWSWSWMKHMPSLLDESLFHSDRRGRNFLAARQRRGIPGLLSAPLVQEHRNTEDEDIYQAAHKAGLRNTGCLGSEGRKYGDGTISG